MFREYSFTKKATSGFLATTFFASSWSFAQKWQSGSENSMILRFAFAFPITIAWVSGMEEMSTGFRRMNRLSVTFSLLLRRMICPLMRNCLEKSM